MSTVSTHTDSIGLGLKWIPRMASALSFVIIGLFLFGGNEPLQPISGHELIGFAFFPVGVLLGMAVGWRWQITGGAVSMLSLGAFYLWHFIATGSIALGPWFIIFSSPGLLFLVFGLLERTIKSNA